MLNTLKKYFNKDSLLLVNSLIKNKFKSGPNVWLLQSDPKRNPQSFELAARLTPITNITKVLDSHSIIPQLRVKTHLSPDLAIGCGRECQQNLIEIKKLNPQTKTISIIDSGNSQQLFDLIITPSYEPHSRAPNIIETTGLINYISPKVLKSELELFNNSTKHQNIKNLELKPPFIAVMLGGYHTGGNITREDAIKIADMLNQIVKINSATLLISSSARTETATVDALEKHLEADYFLYDYKHGRTIENPYTLFLALADQIIVTGDSIRMMSEACSSGKTTYIYDSEDIGFQYKALSKELVNKGHAHYFTIENFTGNQPTSPLDEATRVAEIIKQKFYAKSSRTA